MSRLFLFFILIFSFYPNKTQAQKVGLVLSGGGAKGYAHIGVLKALEEEQIPIDYIGGTSMGAIVGSLYASGYTARDLEQIVLQIDFNELLINDKEREEIPYFDKVNRDKYILELPFDDFKLQIPNAVSRGQGPANIFSYLFRHVDGSIDFNDLPIPFLCIGTNLETGEMKVFRAGNLAKSVMASGAYPTLLNPVEIEGQIYTDGGITNNFPAQEVKEMGADVLIGVDLNDALHNRDRLASATKILEQIVRYRIVENTERQKQYIDFYIEPNLRDYSVVDFELKSEIIKIGYEAAKAQIKEIRKETGIQESKRPEAGPTVDESVLIDEIQIEGLKNYNASYVKGKLGLNPPHYTTHNQITEGIERLYSTGNFENVFYELSKGETGRVLKLNFVEIPNKLSAKFSLHYDDLYKTGLLLNLSARRLLFENSQLSADLILGDNPRYALNYFVNNGLYPSFGLQSSYNHFEANSSVSGLAVDNLEYEWNEFINRFYIQSTILDRYAAGGGIEHQYVSIFTNSVDQSNPLRYLENAYFLTPYAFLGADNRDDPNFPSRGILVDGKFKFLWFSNSQNFQSNSLIDARIQANFPILNDRIVLQTETEFGTFSDVDASTAQFFKMGGFNEQRFLNTSRFYGLPFGFESAPNKLILRAALQFRILDNHYIKGIGNIANFEDGFDLLRLLEYDYTGIALQYGYKSPFGPLQFFWSYSAQTQQALYNFSLGFWF